MGTTTRAEWSWRSGLGTTLLLVLALAGLALPAAGQAADPGCVNTVSLPSAPPLRFGIYPGGGAGSVAGKADPLPEVPALRLAALQELRGPAGRFGVHLYTQYTGDRAADAGTAIWLDGEIAAYTAAGIEVELAVRYKPVSTDAAAGVRGFTAAVRELVGRYGTNPRFTSLQVTNEANIPGAPDASDGAFPGAVDALVQGVIAARAEVLRTGHTQVKVGFNWASDTRPAASTEFWAAVAHLGGSAFRDAVDWVGLDSYPGTWSPTLPLTSLLPQLAGDALDGALQTLRSCLMPAAGLGAGVPIHVSENGFPTGTGRSHETQAQVLESMVRAVSTRRAAYNVSDYNWFDLRDSRTTDPSFESHYGIMRDDYTPKPAFGRYRDLIATLSRPDAPVSAPGTTTSRPATRAAATTGCTPSPVRVTLPRPSGWKARLARVRTGARVVRTVRRRVLPKYVKVRVPAGRVRLSVRVSGVRHGRSVSRVVLRSLTVCTVPAA